MTRQYQFRGALPKKKEVHPIWRGIGFIILVAMTVGGFWLAGYLLELNWRAPFLPFPVPRDFRVTIVGWLPSLPGKLLVQIGATIILDILAYAVMVTTYALLNPIEPGETDAPPPRRRGRRSMTR